MSTMTEYAASAGTPQGSTQPSAVIQPTAGSLWLTVPSAWAGKFLRWTFIGASPTDVCYVRFSTTTAPTIDQTTVTVITSNVLAASGVEPDLVLPHGVPIDDVLDKRFLFFAYIASAVNGRLTVQLKTLGVIPGTSI